MAKHIVQCIAVLLFISILLFTPLHYIYGSTSLQNVNTRSINGIQAPYSWGMNSSFMQYSLRAITTGNHLFVTVGDYGIIRTSPDGKIWTQRYSGTNRFINDVAYNGSRFIAVGNCGTILSSDDGTEWTSVVGPWNEGDSAGVNEEFAGYDDNYGVNNQYCAVIWDGSRFIIAGQGKILTSSDGFEWSKTMLNHSFKSITFNGELYIACDDGLYSSKDLINWSGINDSSGSYGWVGYVGDKYKAFGVSFEELYTDYGRMVRIDKPFVMESTDGAIWTKTEIKLDSNVGLDDIDINLVIKNLAHSNAMNAKADWMTVKPGEEKSFSKIGIAWNGECFVQITRDGSILNSSDGKVWANVTPSQSRMSLGERRIIWDGNKYLIANDVFSFNNDFTSTSDVSLLTSYDSINWSRSTANVNTNKLEGTDGSVILLSKIKLENISSKIKFEYISKVKKIGDNYIAVGGGYKNGYEPYAVVLLSKDCIHWNGVLPDAKGWLRDIAFNGSKYVATGDNGVIISSVDGIHWTNCRQKKDTMLSNVVWNGRCFFTADGYSIIYSENGTKWQEKQFDKNERYSHIFYDGKYLYLTGHQGAVIDGTFYPNKLVIKVSVDGSNWASSCLEDDSNKYYNIDAGDAEQMAYNGSQIVILTSDNTVINSLTLVKVIADGNYLTFDVPPRIKNNRVLVPLRAVFEALGAEVIWDGSTRTITGTKGESKITLTVDKLESYVNGEAVHLDVPPAIINNRTFVPVRFISESFGATVDWDQSNNTVIIRSKGMTLGTSD